MNLNNFFTSAAVAYSLLLIAIVLFVGLVLRGPRKRG